VTHVLGQVEMATTSASCDVSRDAAGKEEKSKGEYKEEHQQSFLSLCSITW
jgi:hypothetical protein